MKHNNRWLLIDMADDMVFGEMDLSLARRREVCTVLRFTPTGKERPTHLVVEEKSGFLLGRTKLRYMRGKEFVLHVRLTPKRRKTWKQSSRSTSGRKRSRLKPTPARS